jgi:hypothetical protein
MKRLKPLRPKEKYFLEPKEPVDEFPIIVPDITILRNSADPLASLGRQRLNLWLNQWPFEDKKDLLGRLESTSASQHDGAVWELYLNSLFNHLGFKVEREPQAISGTTPDFKISKFDRTYYVEASINSSEATSPQEKHWERLVTGVDQVKRDDYFISFQPTRTSTQQPSPRKIISAINQFLDSLNYEEILNKHFLDIPEFTIHEKGWEIRVSPIPKKIRGISNRFIGLFGDASNGMITDLGDLRTKIESKRRHYKGLKHPLILAILENSFIGNDDRWHRFGALFGQEAFHFPPNEEPIPIRIKDGTWDGRRREKEISALLLLNRFPLTFPDLNAPEIWINPSHQSSRIRQDFPLSNLYLNGDSYEVEHVEMNWNGLDRATLKSFITRKASEFFYRGSKSK